MQDLPPYLQFQLDKYGDILLEGKFLRPDEEQGQLEESDRFQEWVNQQAELLQHSLEH
jgi:hypothetical protein